ncbi:cytochrome P450 [Luteolibacter sp. GHJ8]|uniref:Cytochrome P450 n=1 Tax=Luteolibacter rhizosphaerae TaxID=2989719 RepID=A0ABT3G482_9BACT|nr:cytochrome P450 [Luteolibacter rhizosphaerae]MCW1914665.1 cytochrome P450 [Luteolibacter rhizosphaerae]
MKRRIAPSPPGSPITGHLNRLRNDVLGLLTDATREHGDVIRFRVGPLVMHLVNHPDHVAQVMIRNRKNYDKASRSSDCLALICGESLLTANGDVWRQRRRIIQPMFHRAAVEGFVTSIATCTQEMLDAWSVKAKASEAVDLASEMMRLTFRVVGRCLFGVDLEKEAGAVEEAMHVMVMHTYRRWRSILNAPPSWPTPGNLRFRCAVAEVDEIIAGLIARQRVQPPATPNLLTMLTGSRDAESGLGLSDAEVRNEAITFLLAGHETTANGLAWALFLLDRHPEHAERVRTELDQACGGRLPEFADLPQLSHALHVFEESVRLYPPIWAMERHVIAEDEIGGYHIPKGSGVIISPYTLHRHPAFWEEPELFRPERFERRDHEAYYPFGAGPRFCIGSEFALAEARVILPMILRRFCFVAEPGQSGEPEPGITLRLKDGFRVRLEERL